jgi:hypothetical protein
MELDSINRFLLEIRGWVESEVLSSCGISRFHYDQTRAAIHRMECNELFWACFNYISFALSKKSLKMPKMYSSEALIRRTNITMATRRTHKDVQNITQKTKDQVKCIQTNQVRTEIVAKDQFGSKAITVHIDCGVFFLNCSFRVKDAVMSVNLYFGICLNGYLIAFIYTKLKKNISWII